MIAVAISPRPLVRQGDHKHPVKTLRTFSGRSGALRPWSAGGGSKGLVWRRWMRKLRHQAVGSEVVPACVPVRQIRAVLHPVDEGRLVTVVVQACRDALV